MMIHRLITKLIQETNINPVLAPKLLDMMVLEYRSLLGKEDILKVVTFGEALKTLALSTQHHESEKQFIWNGLRDICFERLSRDEEALITNPI